jgi:hypothetical protein
MRKLINFLFPDYHIGFGKIVRVYSVGEHNEIFLREDYPNKPIVFKVPKKHFIVLRNRFGTGEVEVDEDMFLKAPYFKELPITWRESRFYSDTIRIKHLHFSVKNTNP